jgi:biopolymer transport protein ExbB
MTHPPHRSLTALLAAILTFLPLAGSAAGGAEEAWWDKAWTGRKSLEVKPSAAGRPAGAVPVLVRLHEGNFPFAALKEDGSDLRVLADDHKT